VRHSARANLPEAVLFGDVFCFKDDVFTHLLLKF
jgi:hypothetical protein